MAKSLCFATYKAIIVSRQVSSALGWWNERGTRAEERSQQKKWMCFFIQLISIAFLCQLCHLYDRIRGYVNITTHLITTTLWRWCYMWATAQTYQDHQLIQYCVYCTKNVAKPTTVIAESCWMSCNNCIDRRAHVLDCVLLQRSLAFSMCYSSISMNSATPGLLDSTARNTQRIQYLGRFIRDPPTTFHSML